MKTPYTDKGLVQYDGLEPLDAVIRAWTEPGPHPAWHEETKRAARDAMPLLARALDRLVQEGVVTVTAEQDLDTLPPNSVVIDREGNAWQKDPLAAVDPAFRWQCVGAEDLYTDDLLKVLPATVVHRG